MSEVTTVNVPAQETGPEAPQQEPSAQGSERPSWLPEKFQNPEDLAKAYAELEKKLGGGQQQAPQQEPQGQQQTQQQADFTSNQGQMEQALDGKGLSFSEFQQEYQRNGGLSNDSYAKLEQAGFSRDFVDSWIAGQEALIAQVQNEIFSSVGGEQGFQQMVQWASQNLSDDEINAFNATVESGNLSQAKMAVQGLYARFQAVAGNEPSLLGGEKAAGPSGYRSVAEMTRDMRDPRYKSDPAFRSEVEQKIAASNIW